MLATLVQRDYRQQNTMHACVHRRIYVYITTTLCKAGEHVAF